MGAGKKKKNENDNKTNVIEEMAEWFKATDCKSVEFSHRRFKSYFLQFF